MKILIVKTSALGDIVHLFQTIAFLKEQFPNSTIDWVVEEGGKALVEAHPLIDRAIISNLKNWRKTLFSKSTWKEVFAFIGDLKKEKYDLVFDFQGNIKSGIITFFAKGNIKIGFGIKSAPELPNVLFTTRRFNPPEGKNIREDYLYLVEAYLGKKAAIPRGTLLNLNGMEKGILEVILSRLTGDCNVLLAPFSAWPNKQLLDEDLIEKLQAMEKVQKVKFWLIYGTDREKERAEGIGRALKEVEVLPKLSLPLLQHVMKGMSEVIAVDSLPLHLAGEAGVRTTSFFGPSSAAKYAPVGPLHVKSQGACPYHVTFEKRCPRLRTCKTGACLHGEGGGRKDEG